MIPIFKILSWNYSYNFQVAVEGNNFGVVQAKDVESGNKGFYCMMYNPEFHPIPKHAADAVRNDYIITPYL